MKNFLQKYLHSFLMAGFAVWIFVVWRLTGMPSPGFAGRILPAAWFLASLLNGHTKLGRWFYPLVLSFTASAWLWMIHPSGWLIASAISAAGLIGWGISLPKESKFSAIRAVFPILLLSIITAEINGDEVRFAEQAVSISGISGTAFDQSHFRAGDISSNERHHTPFFPTLIAPGLLAGNLGLRIIPALIALAGVLLLAKLTSPVIAVAAALLYPGFGIFGLAMTGWLALVLFTVAVLLPEGRKWTALRFLIALALVALKMRYLGLAFGILIAEYAVLPPRKGKWLSPFFWFGGAMLVLVIDRYLLSGVIFWSRYGNIEAIKVIWMNIFHHPLETLSYAGWSLFDPEAGLIMRAPWIIAAICGFSILKKNSPILFKRLFLPSIAYWIVLIIWSGPTWHGLPAPIGRMFVPMLPLFASGLFYAWKDEKTRLLVILSIAVSALVIASPICRYNYADGTDTILSLLGANSGFSMVRSNSLLLLLPLALTAALLYIFRKFTGNSSFVFLIVIVSIFFLSLSGSWLQAEDLPATSVQGALMYPAIPDPAERFFWLGSREILLELSEEGQSILIGSAEEGKILLLNLSGNGGVLEIGSQLLSVETPLITMPSLLRSVGRTERTLPDWPENRTLELFTILLKDDDIENGSVRIEHHSGSPVYLDKIKLSGESE